MGEGVSVGLRKALTLGQKPSDEVMGFREYDHTVIIGQMHQPTLADVTSWSNLVMAFRAAAKGKRHREMVAQFEVDLGTELLSLHQALVSRRYVPHPYRHFVVHEAKRRVISAAHFRDRVVHHALIQQMLPTLEASFSPVSFANRVGFGTHRAIETFQTYARRFRYVLRIDIVRHFPSIDHDILKHKLHTFFQDAGLRWLIDIILSSSYPSEGESTKLWFPGDDLFSVLRPRGLPIGNLTSQVWSNVYLNSMDHQLLLRFPSVRFLRYVDDLAFFSDAKSTLWGVKHVVRQLLNALRLRIHENQAVVSPTHHGTPWLGFIVWPHYRRIKARKVRYVTRRLRKRFEAYIEGTISFAEFEASIQGFSSYAAHADASSLVESVCRKVCRESGSMLSLL